MNYNLLEHVVALTGSIGSGKSTVGKMLEECGAVLVNADSLAHRVVEPGGPALEKIVQAFGPEVLCESGSLDREKMAKLVFSDPEKRALLESITHPIIAELANEEFREALAKEPPLIVYECPLLFEAGLDNKELKAILVVTTEAENAIARVVKRDKSTEEEVTRRRQAQLPDSARTAKADYIIKNNGTLEELRQEVNAVFKKLVSK